MTTILEHHEGKAAISLLNPEGIITYSVELPNAVSSLDEAVAVAEKGGWHTYGEWTNDPESDYQWVQVVPKPMTVAFAGTEIPSQQAVTLAQNAGYSVNEVVSQNYEPSEGKTYIAFSVDKPHGWDWGKQKVDWGDEPV